MDNLGCQLFVLSIPTLFIVGWILTILFCYKGKLKRRISEWYKESIGDI